MEGKLPSIFDRLYQRVNGFQLFVKEGEPLSGFSILKVSSRMRFSDLLDLVMNPMLFSQVLMSVSSWRILLTSFSRSLMILDSLFSPESRECIFARYFSSVLSNSSKFSLSKCALMILRNSSCMASFSLMGTKPMAAHLA